MISAYNMVAKCSEGAALAQWRVDSGGRVVVLPINIRDWFAVNVNAAGDREVECGIMAG